MRTTFATLTALLLLLLPASLGAQVPTAKGATLEAHRANEHYKSGWEAMRKEAWDEAASEFQGAIDSDPKFALAYYALGRAEMGRKNFTKAIAAYSTCRELYVRAGGEKFSNDLDARRRIQDRILEYETAIREAENGSMKSTGQTQQLYVRELKTKLMQLQQARDQSDYTTPQISVPYFVPMALGSAYFRNNQFAEAEKAYKDAIEANPDSGETHNNLAVLYLLTGRLEQAESAVARAEKTGFKVNPGLKDDIRKKRAGS